MAMTRASYSSHRNDSMNVGQYIAMLHRWRAVTMMTMSRATDRINLAWTSLIQRTGQITRYTDGRASKNSEIKDKDRIMTIA